MLIALSRFFLREHLSVELIPDDVCDNLAFIGRSRAKFANRNPPYHHPLWQALDTKDGGKVKTSEVLPPPVRARERSEQD